MAYNSEQGQWDDEADVVVLGAGLSGLVAAVRASELGARAIILEKMPPDQAGGISRVRSPQIVWAPRRERLEELIAYQAALNQPNPVPDDELRAWAEDMVSQSDWIEEKIRAAGFPWNEWDAGTLGWKPGPEFPDAPGAACVEVLFTPGPPGALRAAFQQHLDRDKVPTRFDCRAIDLVQDPTAQAVLGVRADENGRRLHIRARRGVVVATGGFDGNLDMVRNYMGLPRAYPIGSPHNTGDGLLMLQKAGAALWHLRNQTVTGGLWPAIKVPQHAAAFFAAANLPVGSYLEIGHNNERFGNETAGANRFHNKLFQRGVWTDTGLASSLPVHRIFDDAVRRQCPQGRSIYWNFEREYQWSKDNRAEVDKGWIIHAGSLRELADRIGRDPDQLEDTVNRFNEAARLGQDKDFHRASGRMAPLSGPPFYALELVPGLVGTTGGARRKPDGRVLAPTGEAIPHLFEAGELGSPLANLYENGSFLTEAIRSGRAAGETAARMPPN